MVVVSGLPAPGWCLEILSFGTNGVVEVVSGADGLTVKVEAANPADGRWHASTQGVLGQRSHEGLLSFRLPELGAESELIRVSAASGTLTEAVFNLQVEEDLEFVPAVILREGSQFPQAGTLVGSAGAPARAVVDFGDYADDAYFIYIVAGGYAEQWRRIEVAGGIPTPGSEDITLFRKRYAVVDYAINTTGGTDLTTNLATDRVVLAHWTSIPLFQSDWQAWQQGPSSLWGPDLHFRWHRFTGQNGFIVSEDSYDSITFAPATGYNATQALAAPGLVLLCRVDGNAPPASTRYGKLRVVDVIDDRQTPYCIAPADVLTTCADLPLGFDPYDTVQLQALFGMAQALDRDGGRWQELDPTVALDSCGVGTITRQFRAKDAAGNPSTNACRQTVTIEEAHNYTIEFPKDVAIACVDTLPELATVEIGCDLLAVSTRDEYVAASGDECFQIERTYSVINWCEYDGISSPVVVARDEDCDGVPGDEDVWVLVRPEGVTYIDVDNVEANNSPAASSKGKGCDGLTNPDGYWKNSLENTVANPWGDPAIASVGYWQYTQVIKVYDDIPPVIFTVGTVGAFLCTGEPTCEAQVEVPFSVDEPCTPDDLTITVLFDADSDGDIDETVEPDAVMGSYPDYRVSGTYPPGSHVFLVQVQDGCGNGSMLPIPFTVTVSN